MHRFLLKAFVRPARSSEDASIIVEILVGLILLSIMAMGLARSTILSLSTRERATRSSLAMQIAVDTIENLSAEDPGTLDDSDDLTDTVTRSTTDFSRTVDVTINSDSSRTIQVDVEGPVAALGGSSSLTVTLIPWGSANSGTDTGSSSASSGSSSSTSSSSTSSSSSSSSDSSDSSNNGNGKGN